MGEGQVIKGWDLGLLDMCVGEIRQLVVPSTVGYGEWAPGDKVPPKSTIEFFVELLQIKNTFSDKEMISDTFSQIDTNGDSMLSNEEVGSLTDVMLNLRMATLLDQKKKAIRLWLRICHFWMAKSLNWAIVFYKNKFPKFNLYF